MNELLKKRMKKEKYSLVSIDLFSGPGGLCTGFKWAGILPLIAVEWTDSTSETYSKNHNAEVLHLSEYSQNKKVLDKFLHETDRSLLIHGDINLVSEKMIKKLLLIRYGIDSKAETIDIVSGGAPCESFSVAGKRIEGDERDVLFENIARIAKAVNSKSILFENVKGLFSKRSPGGKKGDIFDYICNTFEDKTTKPSYTLVSKKQDDILLRACDYGVPQARERLFLVGIRNDLFDTVNFVYPEKTHGPGCKNPFVTVKDAFSDLPPVSMGEGDDTIGYGEYYNGKKKCQFPNYSSENKEWFLKIMRGDYNKDGLHSSIPKHLKDNKLYLKNSITYQKGPGHSPKKYALLKHIPAESSMKDYYKQLVSEGKLKEFDPKTGEKYEDLFPNKIYGSRNRRLKWNEPSFTVTSHCLDEIVHPKIPRSITPREAARLQSFPDWYIFEGPYVQFHGDKEQDKYEQIGDAIPPLLAAALGRQFVKSLPRK